MRIKFKTLATVAGLVFLALASVWMFAPTLLLSEWGVDFNDGVGLLGRRAAALYAGVGVMFLSARSAEPSPARAALGRGFVVSCLMLAALGLYELSGGHVSYKILLAVGIEIAFALAFLFVPEGDKQAAPRVASITPMRKKRSK